MININLDGSPLVNLLGSVASTVFGFVGGTAYLLGQLASHLTAHIGG